MGDGASGQLTNTGECAADRPGEGRGNCHAFVHELGGAGWAGVYWQYPDNNWGDSPGYDVPDGATHVQFYAWTNIAGQNADFFVGGIGGTYSDSLSAGVSGVLTEEPVLYTISLAGQTVGQVIGGFGWSWAPGADATLYLDDIVWLDDGLATTSTSSYSTETTVPEDVTLPFAVDSVFAASGYMGDGAAGGLTDTGVCHDERPGGGEGNCHSFVHEVGSAGWAGVYWQFPSNNWGDAPGAAIPAGATKIRFYAWADQPWLSADFFAGGINIGGPGPYSDGFSLGTGDLELTTSPRLIEIDLSTASYADGVIGGFGWSWAPDASPATLYIDDIVWE